VMREFTGAYLGWLTVVQPPTHPTDLNPVVTPEDPGDLGQRVAAPGYGRIHRSKCSWR
jgi:hypothetical protein